MLTLESSGRLLWHLGTITTVLVLMRLWREHLLGVYPSLAANLGWNVISAVTLAQVAYHSRMYGILYFSFEGVRWILYVTTSLELLTQVFRRYPGIGSLGRRISAGAIVLAIAVALLSMAFGENDPASGPGAFWFNRLMLFGQVISASVLVFLLTSATFLLWFAVPLPANATRFLLGYTITFTAATTMYLFINRMGFAAVGFATVIRQGLLLSCLLYWLFKLSAAGEEAEVKVGPRRTPERERDLLTQLTAINSTLLRYLRK